MLIILFVCLNLLSLPISNPNLDYFLPHIDLRLSLPRIYLLSRYLMYIFSYPIPARNHSPLLLARSKRYFQDPSPNGPRPRSFRRRHSPPIDSTTRINIKSRR